jgi:hypothetical protein
LTTTTQIITAALRQALAGEAVTGIETLQAAMRESVAAGDMQQIGCEAVKSLLEYVQSDLQAQRQVLLSQIAARRAEQ